MDDKDVRLFFDEMIDARAAEAVRSMGLDGINARDVNRLGMADEPQLEFAASEKRTLVTYDPEFMVHHTRWLSAGREHSGILLSREYKELRPFLNALRHTLKQLPAHSLRNNALWLLG